MDKQDRRMKQRQVLAQGALTQESREARSRMLGAGQLNLLLGLLLSLQQPSRCFDAHSCTRSCC
jgi:hypothetical protein